MIQGTSWDWRQTWRSMYRVHNIDVTFHGGQGGGRSMEGTIAHEQSRETMPTLAVLTHIPESRHAKSLDVADALVQLEWFKLGSRYC
jgi:hypothetical protein